MSLYRYFASKSPLPTIQRKSLEEDYLSYKSVAVEAYFKKLNITFEEYHFCLRGQFEILPCRKNPQQITIKDLYFLNESENSCIKFFTRNK